MTLGSPAFGLTNAGNLPVHGYFGFTSRATRVFDTPLELGQTLSIDFDNPVPHPLDPFSNAGFLIRLNKGGGPIIDSDPLPGVVERFGLFTSSTFNNARWYTTDSDAFVDATLLPSSTAIGANFRFTLTGTETYSMELRRLSDSELLFSRTGVLNNADAGPIDTIEIALFNSGSSTDGTREFFFNNLQIETPAITLSADYNRDGKVDIADYVLWRNTLMQSVPAGSGADGDGSGVVDSLDYDFWRARFGNTVMSGSNLAANSLPEPSGLVSVLSAYTFILHAFFHRRSPRV